MVPQDLGKQKQLCSQILKDGAPLVALWWRTHLQCRSSRRLRLSPWLGKTPWGRAWQPPPGFLPGESHGQKRLVGYGPQGHKESDTTERLNTHIEGQ